MSEPRIAGQNVDLKPTAPPASEPPQSPPSDTRKPAPTGNVVVRSGGSGGWAAIATLAVLLLLGAALVLLELDSRGYLSLPTYEEEPETVVEAINAIVGTTDSSCLESDVERLRSYWLWTQQFSVLEEFSVQRAGANSFLNMTAQHRMALAALRPAEGCVKLHESMDQAIDAYMSYIAEFRQNESDAHISRARADYRAAAGDMSTNLQNAILAAASG